MVDNYFSLFHLITCIQGNLFDRVVHTRWWRQNTKNHYQEFDQVHNKLHDVDCIQWVSQASSSVKS